jgi:hypothetical protein
MAAYTVAQNDDQQWVVTVHGEQILICARKTDAMRAAKEAARLLASGPRRHALRVTAT